MFHMPLGNREMQPLMQVTADQLRAVMRFSTGRVDLFATAIDSAMAEFGINTARRAAAFVAQIAVESGELRYTREIDSGATYEPPSVLATNLGNTQPGDGARYRGAGLLMITGRYNFERCGIALNLPLIANPSLLETAPGASRSAAWFWKLKGLNELADVDKFGEITHRINGGFNSLDARLGYWLVARRAFGL